MGGEPGSHEPTTVRSEVVKYAWSPTLYAVTFFRGDWEWHRLTYDEWARMGFQGGYNAGWIDGSCITRGRVVRRSCSSTARMAPSTSCPTTNGLRRACKSVETYDLDTGLVQRRGSSAIFIVFNYGTNQEFGYQLDYADWLSYGSPTPEIR